MKKLIIILLAVFIALPGLCALNVGTSLQTTAKTLDTDQGYEVVLIGASTSLQQNLFGDFGIAGKIGIDFGIDAKLGGEIFSIGKQSRVINYQTSFSFTYLPLLGNNIYLYLDAHLSWNTMTLQSGNRSDWDRTTLHSLSCGGTIGILSPARGKLKNVQFSVCLSCDYPFLNLRTTRQRADNSTSSASGGSIDASGYSFSLSAGVVLPI